MGDLLLACGNHIINESSQSDISLIVGYTRNYLHCTIHNMFYIAPLQWSDESQIA